MAPNPANSTTPGSKAYIPRTGESLVNWREPKAYVRKNLSRGRWAIALVLWLIPALLLTISAYNRNFSKRSFLLLAIFTALGLFCFLVFAFGFGTPACLKDDYLQIPGGQSERQFFYANMVSCTVRLDSFKREKFAVLSFIMEKPPSLFAEKSLELGAPNDESLQRILTILRMKGVNVIEK